MDPREQYYESTLMIPREIIRHIHPMSGYIIPTCKFAGKSVYKLFMSPENINYVNSMIRALLKSYGRPIDLGVSVQRMMRNYRRIKTGEIESESIQQNPVIELAYRNREFISETVRNILIRNTPHRGDHHHQNLLMSYQNIDDTEFREVDWGTRYAHLGDRSRNVYRWGNRIAPDRISAQQRHYERDITEALRDTRQLETPIHGYDMNALRSCNSNRMFDNNEYTPY